MQNGLIEGFNGSYRRSVFDMHSFHTLSEVRARQAMADYNQEIPHGSLGGFTPFECRIPDNPDTSNLAWQ